MPFLSQRDIASSLRSKAEKDYKAQLRVALQNPGLTAEQRRDIQAKLARVGQPRVYDGHSPPSPGAIELPKPVTLPEVLTSAVLQGMKKTDLQVLAEQRGLPTTGTRTDLIRRLLAA